MTNRDRVRRERAACHDGRASDRGERLRKTSGSARVARCLRAWRVVDISTAYRIFSSRCVQSEQNWYPTRLKSSRRSISKPGGS